MNRRDATSSPPALERINFHHLHYFWAVAREGNLTRAALRMRVSQSALSAQIRQLEDSLGEPLFSRDGRTLALTEAGRIALGYANTIFAAGHELVSTLRQGRGSEQPLRIGAVATLSRNFQESFVKPLLGEPDIRLQLSSGSLEGLLAQLAAHELDLVLSNRPAPRASSTSERWRTRRLARQQVSVVGRRRRRSFRFPDDVNGAPMILPGRESDVRAAFDALCEQLGVRVRVMAEVDDMATMRLLACDTDALALLPSVVVRDELRTGDLFEHAVIEGVMETFHAITVQRHYQHPLLARLLSRDETEMLEMPRSSRRRR